jgi:hypothetical protein
MTAPAVAEKGSFAVERHIPPGKLLFSPGLTHIVTRR